MSALPLSSLRTGLALATSWTWCIGMFLPALLLGPLAQGLTDRLF